MEPPRRALRDAGTMVVSTLVAIAVLELVIWGSFEWAGVRSPGIRIAFAVLAVPVGFVFGAVGHAVVSGRARPPSS